MSVCHEVVKGLEIVQQMAELGYPTSAPLRTTVPLVIGGIDDEPTLGQIAADVLIAPAVLAEPVHENEDPADRRRIGPPNAEETLALCTVSKSSNLRL
jgi:hypothetical protein